MGRKISSGTALDEHRQRTGVPSRRFGSTADIDTIFVIKSDSIFCISAVVIAVLGSAFGGQAPQDAQLASRIEQILGEDGARSAFWGIHVEDLATGDVLYSRDADKTFIPASNQKILVSATALDALGSSYRYRTALYFDGRIRGDVLEGDLVLRGSGDPTFGSVFAGGADPLRTWARRLAEMGVRRIEGRIVGDDDVFDDRPYAEGWDIDYVTAQSSRLLGVSTNGIAYNDNVVEIKITASAPGEPPQIETRPEGYLEINNRMTTRGRQRGIAVQTDRALGGESISFRGSIPIRYAGTIVMPVTNPTAFAVRAFSSYLEGHGIEVEAEAVDVDDLVDYEYSKDSPLFAYVSPPLSEILVLVNKESNNFYAEQVFRTFAPGGSASGGERRVKELLARAGANTSAISIRDGSGLSRKNFVTPEAMAKLLAHMHGHREHAAFFASLARGGEPQSTLRHRLHNLPVFAKTGSLEFVRSLSGYATTPRGQIVAFAVFANNYSIPSYHVTQSIDRIVMELASAQVGS